MHPLLEQQLRSSFGDSIPDAAGMMAFIQAVDGAYGAEEDRRVTLDHSLSATLAELGRRNEALSAELVERQRAEQQLEGLLSLLGTTLESVADGILTLDQNGRIRRFNQSFVLMWRIPEPILAFWRHDEIIAHILDQVESPLAFLKSLQNLVDHPEIERSDIIPCSDGRIFERHVRCQPLGVAGVGRVISFRDITRRLQAEQEQQLLLRQLQEAQAQLLQSEKMAAIGQLAAGIAHEINNPIGFVCSNLGTLQSYVADLFRLIDAVGDEGEDKGALAAVRQEVELDYLRSDLASLIAESRDGVARVKQIVLDLKNFSRPDLIEWQEAGLHVGLDSTLNILRNELKYKADVVREYDAIPDIQCVPAQLNQVFMNLLVNAAHAIEQRGVITVRTGHADDEVWVEVEDTGRGIETEHLAHIFEPFFTTKPPGKGTGLGLSLSYGIVQRHGGRIKVESVLGKGTRFRVWLPVRQTKQTQENVVNTTIGVDLAGDTCTE